MGVAPSSRTADDLWILESAQRGAQAVGVTLLSPFVVIACPIVGAYEFGSAMDDELMTGSQVLDGTIGFLLGVVASPLAPFYVFWESMEVLFRSQPPPLPPPRFFPTSLLGQKKRWTLDDLETVRLRMVDFDCRRYYNVALVGCKGTGKSTLLNGLLGYKDSHVRAAPVGEASATKEPRGYRHPVLQSLMLWDLPGADDDEKHYFERYGLGYFDALVIVSTDRLMATDVKLARKALEYRVPIFFVRNKADAAILSKIRRMKKKKEIRKKEGDTDRDYTDHELWMRAVGKLTQETEKTFCRSMRHFGFSTSWLYILSGWTLQDFVIALRNRQTTTDLRLIHEKVLITNMLDTVAARRTLESGHTQHHHPSHHPSYSSI